MKRNSFIALDIRGTVEPVSLILARLEEKAQLSIEDMNEIISTYWARIPGNGFRFIFHYEPVLDCADLHDGVEIKRINYSSTLKVNEIPDKLFNYLLQRLKELR